jgi:hypothetical protein
LFADRKPIVLTFNGEVARWIAVLVCSAVHFVGIYIGITRIITNTNDRPLGSWGLVFALFALSGLAYMVTDAIAFYMDWAKPLKQRAGRPLLAEPVVRVLYAPWLLALMLSTMPGINHRAKLRATGAPAK